LIPTQKVKRILSNSKRRTAIAMRRNSKSKSGVEIAKFSKIADSLKTYKQLVDHANHGFVIVDMKGNLLYVNDCFARMHGYKTASL